MTYKPVRLLDEQTAKKIAAGEVIERPASVLRELLDNAIDADASRISVELTDGGITAIRVSDNGFGMSEEDLALCTETHSTSKIESIEDLLSVTSLGFRGEALASIKAVSDLEITTTKQGPLAFQYFNGTISKSTLNAGTNVSVKNIFANFPARKKFLKLASTEARMCRQVFLEKALANPSIEMQLKQNGNLSMQLRKVATFKERILDALHFTEPAECFFEINTVGENFSATIVLGLPEIAKSNRQHMYIFANKRRIDEYGFLQAVDYGAAPFFPNGTHPVALVVLTVAPEAIDFNIHPAKREARFSNYSDIHKAISTAVSHFYKVHTVSVLKQGFEKSDAESENASKLNFTADELSTQNIFGNFEKRTLYERSLNQTNTQSQAAREFLSNGSFSVSDMSERYLWQRTKANELRPLDVPEPSFRFLGQVAGTFIAIEKDDNLYLIDQHAAHERILFEALKQAAPQKQELLVPYRIETESRAENEALAEAATSLREKGFDLECAGESVWIVSAVPVLWRGTEAELADDIKKAASANADLLHEILASSACRAACKDGDILSPEAAFNIAQKTFALTEPLCPHGRPLWTVITRDELFKRVKRT